MQKSRIRKYLAWLLVFAFVCSSVFVTTGNSEAANVNKRNVYSHRKNIKSVTVRIDGKKVTKKTVTLRKGRKKTFKISVSPRKAKKRVTYTSGKKSVATVSKKGKVTAKKAGTAKIKITVSGKGYKKKATWVKIRVVNSKNTTPDTPETNTPGPNTPIPDAPTPNTPSPGTPEPNIPTPDVKPPVTGNGKSLVVYFSRTGNTKAVAEEIQSLTGSDLVELKTVVPYPSSYNDCLAQAQEERANNARPELSTVVSNMSEYDTVYVGYPIWCYTAPMAIFTFLESYDFTGKTVIPFCTSGSSSINQSVTDIRSICSGVNVLDGFRAGDSETVEAWLTRIGQIGNQSTTTTGNALIAYFSLSENTSSSKEEQSSGLDAVTSASVVTDGKDAYGNTEYIAKLIQDKTGGTLYQIQTKETYSTDFDNVVDQNHSEMNTSYLPELKDNNLDISRYDIGGNSYRTIAGLCPDATNLDGLAVAATDVKEAESSVESWLDGLNLSFRNERDITVKVGDFVLDGILYDTEMAKEISANFPLTVSLGGYGGREYYGSLPWTPQTVAAGQYSFEDGEITYCAQNNTIAIFYAQTSRPNLTMEVVPIGKVTSDLSVFDTLPSRAEFTFAIK